MDTETKTREQAEHDARGDERVARAHEAIETLQGVVYQLAVLERYVADKVTVPYISSHFQAAESSIRALQAFYGTAAARLDSIARDRCPECGHSIQHDHVHGGGCEAPQPKGELCACVLRRTEMFAGERKDWPGWNGELG